MALQLTADRDQWQQNFATVQGQLGQLSLNTQMILDQQRHVQTPPDRHLIDQSQLPGAQMSRNQNNTGFIQPFVGHHDQIFAQEIRAIRFQPLPVTEERNNLCHTLLPMSAVSLEEEATVIQTLERRMRATHFKRNENANAFASCTCRKRLLRKQFVRSPFVVSRNEAHYHDTTCPFWTSGSHEMTIGFGMILCYLILGLKLRLFMQLSIGSGTFSIMPSLSFRRIVTEESSPAFRLIRDMLYRSDGLGSLNHSTELTKIFQTRQASPHERLKDGTTLLHVSFRPLHLAIGGIAKS